MRVTKTYPMSEFMQLEFIRVRIVVDLQAVLEFLHCRKSV